MLVVIIFLICLHALLSVLYVWCLISLRCYPGLNGEFFFQTSKSLENSFLLFCKCVLIIQISRSFKMICVCLILILLVISFAEHVSHVTITSYATYVSTYLFILIMWLFANMYVNKPQGNYFNSQYDLLFRSCVLRN